MSPVLAELPQATRPRPVFDPSRDALFLDLDGTLAPLAPKPDDVGVDGPRNRLLKALSVRLQGRLAVVSGRSIADVDRILDGAIRAVAGVHGLERRGPSGALSKTPPHPALDIVRSRFDRLAGQRQGLLVEDKDASVALHYRGAPDAEAEVLALAEDLARSTGLTLQAGARVVELRTPGPDKGDAIAAFLAEPPFVGRRPVFVGDDLTDEHAFARAEKLGGFGVLVGARRDTHASRALADVNDVLNWLAEIERS